MRPLWMLAVIAVVLATTAHIRYARDWVSLACTIAAYREMDWFTPLAKAGHLERIWIVWDRLLLDDWGLRQAIESLGPAFPSVLELAYLFVYAVGPFTLAFLYMA